MTLFAGFKVNIAITAPSTNTSLKVITRTGQEHREQAIRSSGADEVIIPEY